MIFHIKKRQNLQLYYFTKGGLGAAAAGFLAFRSSTSRAFNSDNNVAFLSILKALDDEEMLESSEFKFNQFQT